MNCGTPRSWRRTLLIHAILLPLALLWVAPLWMMLVYATAPPTQFYNPTALLLPGLYFKDNLQLLLQTTPFGVALLNSLGIALITTVVSVASCAMAGYALAQLQFRGARTLLRITIAALTVPYVVVTIPQFVMMSRIFGLTDSWAGVILPSISNCMGVFLMRQSFLLLPRDLLDCARVEGVGELVIFARIALPLMQPALTTLAIMLFLQTWNGYLWPLLILWEPQRWTAPLALGSLVGSLDTVMWGAIMAGSLLLTLPAILVFLLLQRYVVRGIAPPIA